MVARLALRNVLSRDDGSVRYPVFVLMLVSTASFYAFNTIDEQLSFVRGGGGVPRGLGAVVADATVTLSFVLGLVLLLLGYHVAGMRRGEMRALSAMGLSPLRIFLLVTCEQVIVLMAAMVAGVLVGALFSHVLVFMTAAILSGSVEGFGPFLSARALHVTAIALLPMDASVVLSGILQVPRRGGRARGAWGPRSAGERVDLACLRLVAGLALVVLSCLGLGCPCIVVLREGGGEIVHAMSAPPASLAILFLGTWEVLRGLGYVLAHSRGRGSRHWGGQVMGVLSRMQLGNLLSEAALPLAFAVVCLSQVGCQLVGPVGSARLSDAPVDMPSTVYLGSYASFLLCVAAGTTLAASVGAYVVSSNRESMTLYDLGFPPESILRSQRRRIVSGFVVPVVMAVIDLLASLLRSGLGTSPSGAAWSARGVLPILVVSAIVLASYLGTTLASCRSSLSDEASVWQIRL